MSKTIQENGAVVGSVVAVQIKRILSKTKDTAGAVVSTKVKLREGSASSAAKVRSRALSENATDEVDEDDTALDVAVRPAGDCIQRGNCEIRVRVTSDKRFPKRAVAQAVNIVKRKSLFGDIFKKSGKKSISIKRVKKSKGKSYVITMKFRRKFLKNTGL